MAYRPSRTVLRRATASDMADKIGPCWGVASETVDSPD